MARPANIHYTRANISGLKSKMKGYEDKYYEAMKQLIRDAAEEFVWRTVQMVHIDTGMSAASLEPLARELGTTILDSVEPFVVKAERGWGTTMSGNSYRYKKRSISEGIKAGQKAYKFNWGSVRNPIMTFEFKINVWQYAYWETRYPWFSLETGLYYFLKFIEDNYDDYVPDTLNEVLNAYTGVK